MQRTRKDQAQATDVEITIETATDSVKTLLNTGVGCITYLRGLFHDDNFVDQRVNAPPRPGTSDPPTSSQIDEKKNGGVKVKKLNKGYSKEADKLIDYIEIGAADAIDKSYLEQLLFAIYLDPEDPNNLVECYTFNFTYTVDRSGNKIPEMVMQDRLNGMVISSKDKGKGVSTKSTQALRLPKEGNVKRQVQQLIKRLITTTQSLDELPQRRFINIRLYYTEDCPEDYEPPLFKLAPPDQQPYSLTTSTITDLPQHIPIGKISTGFHSVTLDVVSVAHFTEISSNHLTREDAIAHNQRDAAARPVVWSSEEVLRAGTVVGAGGKEKEGEVAPEGVRGDKGEIITLAELEKSDDMKKIELRSKVGLGTTTDPKGKGRAKEVEERASKGKGKEVGGATSDNAALLKAFSTTTGTSQDSTSATQTDPVLNRQQSKQAQLRPLVPFFDESPQEYLQRSHSAQQSASQNASLTQAGQNLQSVQEEEEEVIMVDAAQKPESTALSGKSTSNPLRQVTDEINNRFPVSSMNAFEIAEDETQLLTYSQPTAKMPLMPLAATNSSVAGPEPSGRVGSWARARGLSNPDGPCECGNSGENEPMIECSGCKAWKHVICYGFHNTADERIPEDFYCYPCRVICSDEDALLHEQKEEEIQLALSELGALALFRRAIAVIWAEGPMATSMFAARLSIKTTEATTISKRLRDESFLIETTTTTKGGKKSQAKKVQIVVNKSREQTKTKNEKYFSPGQGAEDGLIHILDCTEKDAEGSAVTRGNTLIPIASTEIGTSTIRETQADYAGQAQSRDESQFFLPQAGPSKAIRQKQDDDPIVDSDSEERSMKVQPQATPAPAKTPLYIPKFNAGKSQGSVAPADIQRAVSALKYAPDDMDCDEEPDTIDETAPPKQTQAKDLKGKRARNEGEGERSGGRQKKIQKSSNARDTLEVC